MSRVILRSMIRLRNIESLRRLPVVTKKSFCSLESGLVEFDEVHQKSGRDLDRYREKKEYKKNFVENLFLGIFEPEVLEYPQIRTLKEVDYLKNHRKETANVLNSIDFKRIEEGGKIPDDALELLHEKEVLGMKIKLGEEGLGYFESESSYIQESLSLNASLSKTVAEHENFGYQVINLFGSKAQKEKYLPKFLNGDCSACLAHLENNSWVSLDAVPLSTTAVKLPDNNYSISGQKTTVYNPNSADIVIVSAKTKERLNEEDHEQYTIFMVDKNSEGVKVLEPLKKIGLNGVEICEVVFDNVVVPESNIIGTLNGGNLIVDKLLSSGKLCNGPQCIGLIKKMVNDVIKHSIHKNHFNKPLSQFLYVQSKVGELMNALYSVESMTYLMTGRVDTCDHINVMLESLIIKVFASEVVNFVLQNYMQFLGREEGNDVEFIKTIIRDSYFFSAYDDPNGYLKVLLATVGVKHVLNQLNNRTEKQFRPKTHAELRYREFSQTVKIPKKLRGYLHLTLEQESIGLEHCVGYLNFWTENLINKYGSQILDRTYELMQLGDILINIYRLAAVLGRASRSYCIGLRYSEHEILIARNIHQNSFLRCWMAWNNLLRSLKSSVNYNEIGRYALDSKLSTAHPAGYLRTEVSYNGIRNKDCV